MSPQLRSDPAAKRYGRQTNVSVATGLAPPLAPGPGSTPASKQPLRILLVEDNEDDVVLFRRLTLGLPHAPLFLRHAPDIGSAWEALERGSYDVLFLDHQLGKDTGLDLLHGIRDRGIETPVIFLTGHGDEEIAVLAMKSGACDYILKSKLDEHCLERALRYAVSLGTQQVLLQRAQQELRIREERFRALFDRNMAGVVRSTLHGKLLECNQAFAHLYGYTVQEILQVNAATLYMDAGQRRQLMQRLEREKHLAGIEICGRRKDGSVVWLLSNLSLAEEDGAGGTVLEGTIVDITERRRLQEQLLQAQKMDAIGQLAGGVAHDFNNLLMVISSYAELTLEALNSEDHLHSHVQQILRAARRAAELTRQLLAFSRKQVQALRVLDLNATLAEICKMLPRLIGEDIQLSFTPGPELWPVMADPIQVEQVVMNLAANARDAMPKGGSLTIETRNLEMKEAVDEDGDLPSGPYVLLTIRDSGLGIDAAVLPRIFEPFFTTKEKGKGTGLGLATVYGIVKQSGGNVFVESPPGQGTTFKIYLPRAERRERNAEHAGAAPISLGGTETVLVVEDEEAVRAATCQFLVQHGYKVLSASNGAQALEVAAKEPGTIHILVSDVVMPRMSGSDLAHLLLEQRPKMKVLYVSGYAESTVLQHGVEELGTMFLQKPFTLKALAAKIREVLQRGEVAGH